MIRTSPAVTEAITGNNRHFTPNISFNFLSFRRDTSVQIYAPNAVNGSITDQIVDAPLPYIRDRLFIGKSAKNKLFPSVLNIHSRGGWHNRRAINKSRVGYIGQKADAAGEVSDTIGIRFAPRGLSFITIQTATVRVITDATITVLDERYNTLFIHEIENNTSENILIPCSTLGATSIILTVTKSTPSRRLWILTFTPSIIETYANDDIVEFKHELKKTQNRDGSIGRLYIQNLNINLFNRDRKFDFKNTKSPIYNMLRKDVELSASFSLSDTAFRKSLGVFYTDSWEVSEDKATVSIKSVDFLGSIKDEEIFEDILDETNAFDCFMLLASRLSLIQNSIDLSLRDIRLAHYAIQGKVADIINSLCEVSQAICFINPSGSGLVVKSMPTIRGNARYPLRYLSSFDYSKVDSKKASDINPNVLQIEYTLSEYKTNEIILEKQTVMYSDMILHDFPDRYRGVYPPERPIGADVTPPSYVFRFTKPENYIKTDLTDPFFPETLEYVIDDLTDDITVSVWSFEEEPPDAQLTAAVIGRSSHENILLEKATHTVPRRPASYVAPDLSALTIEERNRHNTPEEFEIRLDGKFKINTVFAGNRSAPNFFEYIITRTPRGATVRVWNYLMADQEFALFFYGRSIIESENTKIITIRNDDDIKRHGEVRKTITLSGVASDVAALRIAESIALFYNTFNHSFSIDPWADPRIEISDLIAYESLRGYGYTQGIIEEITTDYRGFITQKFKMIESGKHNRDCRVFGSFVVKDRPVMSNNKDGYV